MTSGAIAVFLLLTVLIFWSYCGYLISLILLSARERRRLRTPPGTAPDPSVVILVPCFNEERLVDDKIANLAALDYPPDRMRVLFLDGNSEDGTCDRLRAGLADRPRMQWLKTGRAGKIPQLNAGLSGLTEDVIVCTDMDAMLERTVLRKIVDAFKRDGSVAVVGARVMPLAALDLEERFWEDQNIIRFLESEVSSSSIVIAPCYAFRRGLLEAFPPGCIADDIYVSFLANVRGAKVRYLEDAVVRETRSPQNLGQFVRHKFRKGNAYLVELWRFVPRVPAMPGLWKLIFLTKLLQVAVMPWALVGFAALSVAFAFGAPPRPLVAAVAAAALSASLVVTSALLGRERGRRAERSPGKSLFTIFLVTNFVLILNGLTFPFFRQTSRFARLAGTRSRRGAG